MLLAALTNSPDHVCTRYRLTAFQPALAAAGHRLDIHPIPDGWWGRKTVGLTLGGSDAVVLQRRLLSAFEVKLLRARARRLWFEIDDAVWRRDSYTSKGLESRKLQSRFRETVQACDLVIAGNSFLAANAIASGARRTVVVPTCVDVRRYPLAAHDRPGADLVWVGSSSTLRGLEAVTDLLEEIGKQVPGARLKLICDRFLKLDRLPVVETPWVEATEGADIAAGDVGMSWIPDDTWSRGKCGLKVLQYMAAGLPVVANPVGVHPEMIRHGVTGFLAKSPAEWVEAVRALAADPDLRRRMGAAGRKVVEQRYSVEVGARHWLRLCNAEGPGHLTPRPPALEGPAGPGVPAVDRRPGDSEPQAPSSPPGDRAPGAGWTLTPAGRALLADADLDIAAHVRAGRAEVVKHGEHRTVYRVSLPQGVVYWKHCRLSGPRARWREILRGPKAKLEFNRLQTLAGRGIATTEPLGWAALGW
ncbi:MAG TPA: glycosyltransferase family 4 protein, partial [Gemmataceae bacterium]|nr:glycosyltransferase family 4 protein [Gemmataceae bacterium]